MDRYGNNTSLFWQALGLFVLSLLLTWFLGGWIQIRNLPPGLLVTEFLLIGLPAIVFLRINWSNLDFTMFERPKTVRCLWSAFIAVCTTFIAVYKGLATRRSLEGGFSAEDILKGATWEIVILFVVIAPFCEELLFRASIQNVLSRYWKPRNAVMASALLFALFHGSLMRLPETLILGAFASVVFLRTGNYWCAVLVHAVVNTLGPLLFASAQRFELLLNPLASICFALLACYGAYQVGPKPTEAIRGFRRKLYWALFGVRVLPSAPRASKWTMTASFWGIAVVLLALEGYVFTLTKPDYSETDFVGKEDDEWHIAAGGKVVAHSRIALVKSPETAEAMEVVLPYPEAQIVSVTIDDATVGCSHVGEGTVEVDFSGSQRLPNATMEVVWTLPLELLSEGDEGYRARLQGLIPITSFSLTVVLNEGCGFEATDDPSLKRMRPFFSSGYRSPQRVLGSCGIPILKRPAG